VSIRVNGQRLEHELVRRGWTGQDLAAATGLSPATVSAARQGRPVHPRTVSRMATALLRAPVVDGVEALLGEPIGAE
jgi:transcriptional regulator with XRE-family HTH domain